VSIALGSIWSTAKIIFKSQNIPGAGGSHYNPTQEAEIRRTEV
jgi:hypothetical protein